MDKRWSPQEYERFKQMRENGMSYREIAEKAGLSYSALYSRMNRENYAQETAKSRDFDEYELDKMREMHYVGRSHREIAEYFNCDPDVITMRLKFMGAMHRDYLDENVRRKIRDLHLEQRSCSEIARTLDLTTSEVRYALKWMVRKGEL